MKMKSIYGRILLFTLISQIFSIASTKIITNLSNPRNKVYVQHFIPLISHSKQHQHKLFASKSDKENNEKNFLNVQNLAPKFLNATEPSKLVYNGTLTIPGQVFAGALSRSISNTALHPIAFSKQLEEQKKLIKDFPYKTLISKSQLFWKGAGSHFLTSLPFGALITLFSQISKDFLNSAIPWSPAKPLVDFSAQVSTILFSSLLSSPQNILIKNLISGNSTNLAEAASSIIKKNGIEGFYEGFGNSLIKRMPFILVSIALNQQIKKGLNALPLLNKIPSSPHTIVMSLLATSISTSLISPFENIKNQIENEGNQYQKYRLSTTFETLKNHIKNKQVSELFSTLPSKLASTLPPMGLQASLFEIIKYTLIKRASRNTDNLSSKVELKNNTTPSYDSATELMSVQSGET